METQNWSEVSGATTLNLTEMETLAEQYNLDWEEYEAAKEAASEKYKVFQATESRIMKALVDSQKTSYKAETGMFSVSATPTVKVASNITDKRNLFKYLHECGEQLYYSMLNVNSQTLNSWYKKVKEEAGSPPGFKIPGVEESGERVTLRFTTARKKGN